MPASSPPKPADSTQVLRRSVPPLNPLRYTPTLERPLRGKSRVLEHDMDIQPHRHDWAQMVFSVAGAVRVSAQGPRGAHAFIVPPSRAVWIPPGVEHAVTAIERADLRTVYLHESAVQRLGALAGGVSWEECRVLEVSALLHQLVLAMAVEPDPTGAAATQASAEPERDAAIWYLLLDELSRARRLQLGLPLPADRRLRRVCEAMLAEPMRYKDLQAMAQASASSERTLSRLFREELGCSFSQWRQQLMLAHALQLAARKTPMSLIAAELGYASASAFSAMVTRAVGMPPSRFFAEV